MLFGSDQLERGTDAAPVQRRVPRHAGRPHGGRLPQDPAGAVRRVHPAAALDLVLSRRSSAGWRRLPPATSVVMLPVGRPPGEHGDLLRGDLPAPGARGGAERAASCSRRSPTTRGTAGRRRRTSTSRWRRCAPSSRGAIWCGRPTPASAASSTPTGASWRSRLSLNRRAWWWTCDSCRAARSTRGSATWRPTRRLARHRARAGGLAAPAVVTLRGGRVADLEDLTRRYDDLTPALARAAEVSLRVPTSKPS